MEFRKSRGRLCTTCSSCWIRYVGISLQQVWMFEKQDGVYWFTSFFRSVLKQTCFGYDPRPGRYAFGNCIHTCDARGGCFYQNTTSDNQKYDTTITVPTNLANGNYILQMMAVAGNSADAIYSCSKLTVLGGNPALKCSVSSFPSSSDCFSLYTSYPV